MSEKFTELNKGNTPRFIRLSSIKIKDRSEVISIKTGIKALDNRIIGLNKTEMSIVSGTNGSGKSTWLSQLGLEAAKQKFKTALFSGELPPQRALNWMLIPSAGKENLVPTNYPSVFNVNPIAKEKIIRWLDDKIFLYNNAYSYDVQKVLDSVKRVIDDLGIDLLVLDNLMSLDISTMGSDKYERQTKLVNTLAIFAKTYDIHILFVCHPRKSSGFLRKDDISGSGDITNAADNVFIIHRVNNDLATKAKEFFGQRQYEQMFLPYDNVIEVCKNREFGEQDLLCGLYYDIASRRLTNHKDEYKRYGWEDFIPKQRGMESEGD